MMVGTYRVQGEGRDLDEEIVSGVVGASNLVKIQLLLIAVGSDSEDLHRHDVCCSR